MDNQAPESTNSPALPPLGARKQLGHLGGEQHKKLLRQAKIAIGFVAVLSLIAGVALLFMVEESATKLEKEIASLRANPEMVIDENLVSTARSEITTARIGVGMALFGGVIFLGLLFYTNTNPVFSTTAALGVYLFFILVGGALDPTSVFKGIIIKAIIIFALYKGMQAAKSLEALKSEGSVSY